MDNHTEADWNVVKHLNVFGHVGMEELMIEVRRLLGESAAKCKDIQFPMDTYTECKILIIMCSNVLREVQ